MPPPPFKEARGQISSKPRFFSGFFLRLVKLTADQMSQRSFGLIYTVLSRRVKKQQQKHVQIFNRSQSLCLTRMYNRFCQRLSTYKRFSAPEPRLNLPPVTSLRISASCFYLLLTINVGSKLLLESA